MSSKRLRVSQKLSLIAEVDSGKSHTEAAKAYGITKQAVGYIMKNRSLLGDADESKKSSKAAEKWAKFEEPLLKWFINMRLIGKHIDGKILEASFHRMLAVSGEEGSSADSVMSWLQRWRQRNKISFKAAQGESLNTPNFSEWLSSTKELLKDYDPRDIYNADETALFWRQES